jgi:hypothetical protein
MIFSCILVTRRDGPVCVSDVYAGPKNGSGLYFGGVCAGLNRWHGAGRRHYQ